MGKRLKAKSVLSALDAPQKYLMKKAAKAVGAKEGQDGEDSEQVAKRVVERVAERMKLGDSTAANAAKAAGVAGLSVFGDPLSLIPGGKAAKIAAKGATAAKKASKGAKVLNRAKLPTGAASKAAPSPVRAEKVKALGTTLATEPTNVAKNILKNDQIAQQQRLRRALKSENRVEAVKRLSPEDRKALEKGLRRLKKEN